jgi:chromosome segregation ATPase
MDFLLLTYNLFSTLKADDTSQTSNLKDAVIGLLTVLVVLAINWITRKLQKRIDDQKLASANKKADSADQKALAATQVAGLANQTAHANSDLLTQLQSQIISQNQVIRALEVALNENQEERKAAGVALQEERRRYDAKIKTLEDKIEQLEIQHQTTLGQQAEILMGVDRVLVELDTLKAVLGDEAGLLAGLYETVTGLQEVVKKRTGHTGPLSGKASDVEEKKGK